MMNSKFKSGMLVVLHLLIFGLTTVFAADLAHVADKQEIAQPDQSGKVSLTRANWSWPAEFENQVIYIARSTGGDASSTILMKPLTPIVSPSDGIVLFSGSINEFEVGIVLAHSEGLFSVISSRYPWESSAANPLTGSAVIKGQTLAITKGGSLEIPVKWTLLRVQDDRLTRIRNLDQFTDSSQANQVGFASRAEVLKSIFSGKEIDTKRLMNVGPVQFMVDKKISPKDGTVINLNKTEIPLSHLINDELLLTAGLHDIEIISGRIFKTKQTSTFDAVLGGTSMVSIEATRDRDVVALNSGFVASTSESLKQEEKVMPSTSVGDGKIQDAQRERARLDQAAISDEKTRLAQLAAAKEQERRVQEARAREFAEETRARDELLRTARLRDEEVAKLRQQLAGLEEKKVSSDQTIVFANRRALVIGNDSYMQVSKLVNAREDARAIAESLTQLGYQVTLKLDLTEKGMKLALRNFKEQVGGGDEVMIFYAGHGVQIGAMNYLLPIDIAGESEEEIKDDGIQLQRVLDDMNERKAKFTLAMIDACRDNPFKSVGRNIGGRGLSPTTAATGQMVIFSAGAGQRALDKLGPTDKSKNGLFTRIFLKEMQKSGVSIDKVVRNVRNEVVGIARSVGHEQVPAIYDQVVGDFYFRR
ncbi:MAG: caspase family protein [Burkholderiaceae bacterium]|nr:caspase family protein [Burkholderiaceae bacterium]